MEIENPHPCFPCISIPSHPTPTPRAYIQHLARPDVSNPSPYPQQLLRCSDSTHDGHMPCIFDSRSKLWHCLLIEKRTDVNGANKRTVLSTRGLTQVLIHPVLSPTPRLERNAVVSHTEKSKCRVDHPVRTRVTLFFLQDLVPTSTHPTPTSLSIFRNARARTARFHHFHGGA